jgi:hypothetical protein
VVAAGGEQLGGNDQQFLAAGEPVLGWHVYSLSAGRDTPGVNQLVG